MKNLIHELYREAYYELEKIKRSELKLSERIALEKALVKLEDMKKVMSYCDIKPIN